MRRRSVLTGGAALALLAGCVGSAEDPAFLTPEIETQNPPAGQFVEVVGERVHYWERGEGQPVVLIHGASGNLLDWTFDVAPRLAARYRVIAFDRPGFGYTSRDGWGLDTPQAQARVLAAAADALGAERPVVVGHSWGGAVAMAWAAGHDPKGVISVAGVVNPYASTLGQVSRAIGLNELITNVYQDYLKSQAGNGGIEEFVARVFRPQAPPDGYVAHVAPALSLREATMEANAADLSALNGALERLAPAYPRLRLPVEAIHGTSDRTVTVQQARELADAVPGARLTLLDGIGHMAHHFAGAKLDDAVARIAAA